MLYDGQLLDVTLGLKRRETWTGPRLSVAENSLFCWTSSTLVPVAPASRLSTKLSFSLIQGLLTWRHPSWCLLSLTICVHHLLKLLNSNDHHLTSWPSDWCLIAILFGCPSKTLFMYVKGYTDPFSSKQRAHAHGDPKE